MNGEYASASKSDHALIDLYKLARSYLGFQWRRYKAHEKIPYNRDAQLYAKQLKQHGFLKIENFYSQSECTELINEVDRLMKANPEFLIVDEHKSDHRLRVGNAISPLIDRFYNNQFCKDIGAAYFKCPLRTIFTLTAKLNFTPNNLGSGSGWHRDAFFFQYKSMVYLTDVGPTNGPFQIFDKSHHMGYVLRDQMKMKANSQSYRLENEQIAKLDQSRLNTITGKAGDLLLFDSSTVHRGMPIQDGTRYALTNYYLPEYMATPSRIKSFGKALIP